MKYLISCTANGQELTKNRSALLFTNEQNYVALHFVLDTFWQELENKGCIFTKDQQSVTVLLDQENDAVIPWELLKSSGTLYASLFGGDRMTTSQVDIPVLDSGWKMDTDQPLIPTSDVYNDILTRISDTEQELKEVENSATMANILANNAITGLNNKVDKESGKGLSSNDYTSQDKSFLDSLKEPSEIDLSDGAGNQLTLDSTGSSVIITNEQSFMDNGATKGYSIKPVTIDMPSGSTRGATFKIKRRLNGTEQSLASYMLTTGLVEIRTGTTSALDNTSSGVYTQFPLQMSSTPDIILLQPNSGQTGVAAPKIVSKTASGFYATLGGSTGTGTTCNYLAIKLNYMANTTA